MSAALALAACGGSGGGSTSAASGVVMDGYLKNATVFLDLNDNGRQDSGEPSTTTGADGSYSLSASQADLSAHAVIAQAVHGVTTDMDTPNAFIGSSYSLTTPAGKNGVISPITTLISAKVSSGMSLAAAETAVLTDLGFNSIDLYKDYVSAATTDATYRDVHKVAAATAEVLKTVEGNQYSNLAQKLAGVQTTFTSTLSTQISSIKAAADVSAASTIAANSITSASSNSNSSSNSSSSNSSSSSSSSSNSSSSSSSNSSSSSSSSNSSNSSSSSSNSSSGPTSYSATLSGI